VKDWLTKPIKGLKDAIPAQGRAKVRPKPSGNPRRDVRLENRRWNKTPEAPGLSRDLETKTRLSEFLYGQADKFTIGMATPLSGAYYGSMPISQLGNLAAKNLFGVGQGGLKVALTQHVAPTVVTGLGSYRAVDNAVTSAGDFVSNIQSGNAGGAAWSGMKLVFGVVS
jgi:hypothetical protein